TADRDDGRGDGGGDDGRDVSHGDGLSDGTGDRDRPNPVEAGVDGASDAGPPGCLLDAPFLPAVPVASVNTGTHNDSRPFISASGLELFYSSDRPGGLGSYDLWLATRASFDEPFGSPIPLAEINSSSNDYSPTLTADGLTIYFSSERSGG